MGALTLKAYEILKARLGEEKATTLIGYMDEKFQEEMARNKEVFLSKNDKSGLMKWVFGFWIVQMAAIGGLYMKIGDLQTQISRIEMRTSRLEMKVSGLETKISGLETKVSGLGTKVSGLETKVSGLETKVSRLETNISDLQVQMSAFDQKLSKLAAAVTH